MTNTQQSFQPEHLQNQVDEIQAGFQKAHEREETAVGNAKEAFQENIAAKLPIPSPTSTPSAQASVHELKSRLNWGEPGLTILDARPYDVFDQCRILGALNAPLETLSDSDHLHLEKSRDIYVYADSDADAIAAADSLRQSGFDRVAALMGGLAAWKQIGGAIDGMVNPEPGPDAYNVVSRLKEFAKEQNLEKSQN